MLISKHTYNLWFKAIAIGVVCLFLCNSIAYDISSVLQTPPTQYTDVLGIWIQRSDEENIEHATRLLLTKLMSDANLTAADNINFRDLIEEAEDLIPELGFEQGLIPFVLGTSLIGGNWHMGWWVVPDEGEPRPYDVVFTLVAGALEIRVDAEATTGAAESLQIQTKEIQNYCKMVEGLMNNGLLEEAKEAVRQEVKEQTNKELLPLNGISDPHKRVMELFRRVADTVKAQAATEFDTVFYPFSSADISAASFFSKNILTVDRNNIFAIDEIEDIPGRIKGALRTKLIAGWYGDTRAASLLEYAVDLILLGVDLDTLKEVNNDNGIVTVEFKVKDDVFRHTHIVHEMKPILQDKDETNERVNDKIKDALKDKDVLMLAKASSQLFPSNFFPLMPEGSICFLGTLGFSAYDEKLSDYWLFDIMSKQCKEELDETLLLEHPDREISEHGNISNALPYGYARSAAQMRLFVLGGLRSEKPGNETAIPAGGITPFYWRAMEAGTEMAMSRENETNKDYAFINSVIERLRESGGYLLGKPDIIIEELVRDYLDKNAEYGKKFAKDPKYVTTQKHYKLGVFVPLMIDLIAFKELFSTNPGYVMQVAFSDIKDLFVSDYKEIISDTLLYDLIDACTWFTDVRPSGEDVAAYATFGDKKCYDDYWHWAFVLSVNGGKEAIKLLYEALQEVGDELFQKDTGPHDNNHWSAAYQEILLESIFLARTYGREDESAKKEALEKSLDLKSPHVLNMAREMINEPMSQKERHSIRDYTRLLAYRNERISDDDRNYTQAVTVLPEVSQPGAAEGVTTNERQIPDEYCNVGEAKFLRMYRERFGEPGDEALRFARVLSILGPVMRNIRINNQAQYPEGCVVYSPPIVRFLQDMGFEAEIKDCDLHEMVCITFDNDQRKRFICDFTADQIMKDAYGRIDERIEPTVIPLSDKPELGSVASTYYKNSMKFRRLRSGRISDDERELYENIRRTYHQALAKKKSAIADQRRQKTEETLPLAERAHVGLVKKLPPLAKAEGNSGKEHIITHPLLGQLAKAQTGWEVGSYFHQNTTPSDKALIAKLGIEKSDRVYSYASWAGDWAKALASQLGCENVKVTDISTEVKEALMYKLSDELSDGIEIDTANAVLSPDAEEAAKFDWTFSYDPVPMGLEGLVPILMRGLLTKKGSIVVYQSLLKFLEPMGDADTVMSRLSEIYKTTKSLERRSIRVVQNREFSLGAAHEDVEFDVLTIHTNRRVRDEVKVDLAVLEALDNQTIADGEPVSVHSLTQKLNLSLDEITDSLNRLDEMSKLYEGHRSKWVRRVTILQKEIISQQGKIRVIVDGDLFKHGDLKKDMNGRLLNGRYIPAGDVCNIAKCNTKDVDAILKTLRKGEHSPGRTIVQVSSKLDPKDMQRLKGEAPDVRFMKVDIDAFSFRYGKKLDDETRWKLRFGLYGTLLAARDVDEDDIHNRQASPTYRLLSFFLRTRGVEDPDSYIDDLVRDDISSITVSFLPLEIWTQAVGYYRIATTYIAGSA